MTLKCSYCEKELPERQEHVFCSGSHKTMFHRRVKNGMDGKRDAELCERLKKKVVIKKVNLEESITPTEPMSIPAPVEN